jgi:hypothetical protein
MLSRLSISDPNPVQAWKKLKEKRGKAKVDAMIRQTLNG